MIKELKSFLRFRLPVYAWAVFILYFSAEKKPIPSNIEWIPFIDKVFHLLEYAILALLLARMLKSLGYAYARAKYILLSILITTFYGGLMEIYQLFMPYRNCDIFDLTADFAGATIGALVYVKLYLKDNKGV